jgi:hypothetical protein
MALHERQDNLYFVIIDDQSPTLLNSYEGNWTRYPNEGFNNGTATATTTPGDSLSVTFSGTQIIHVWSRCVVLTLWWE